MPFYSSYLSDKGTDTILLMILTALLFIGDALVKNIKEFLDIFELAVFDDCCCDDDCDCEECKEETSEEDAEPKENTGRNRGNQRRGNFYQKNKIDEKFSDDSEFFCWLNVKFVFIPWQYANLRLCSLYLQ